MGSEAEIPKINLSGLQPGGDGWDAAQGQVMRALETYRCFEAHYDEVSPELREALFGRAMPELFRLPLETKMLNTSDLPYYGHVGPRTGTAYESLSVNNATATQFEGVEEFTRLMWPQGNPSFRDTVLAYAKHIIELEQMIELMVFQSMGVEKYYESHIESASFAIQLSEYEIPLDEESKIAMPAHVDPNMFVVICQHQVAGLEVQTRDGEWIQVVPSPNSFTVMFGQAFEAWCNGRLQPCCHRVRMISKERRYSVVSGSHPRDGFMVQAPNELVDEEHPLLYEPYNYKNYLLFRYSEEGSRANNPMKAFCGVRGEEMQVSIQI